tara:strand:+ start:364 stop:555 length:192 start_codon:yes stop_codon:yes gene_type:complete
MLKSKVTIVLGYVFCEFSFRWFNMFDVPYLDEEWRWYHRAAYFIGGQLYSIGCFFYNLGDKGK